MSMGFAMLVNVKMPTIVGILTFISMIDIVLKILKSRKVFILQHFRGLLMTPKWQKLASLAQEICILWFRLFVAVFVSKG